MSWLSDAIATSTDDIGAAITNTANRQKINDLKVAYRRACDNVRGDVSLSELGRQQVIARIWSNTRAEIARLRQLDFDSLVQRYNSLERTVFGTAGASTGADAVSFRDAVDRAGQLDSVEAAAKMLGTAELSGDAVLAKAVVMRAWESRWDVIVDKYASTHATVADKLAELVSLRKALDGIASRLGGAIGASLPRPTELANLSLAQISEYAAADPSRSLDAIRAARLTGDATPDEEEAARRQAVDEARARTAAETGGGA
ncbi:hypothetical protein AAHS21_25230 [Mycobacterium sp. 050272]|uniref:hypothetical protein n=1 Tax=Mycobacterium sp. 050272 TaxID=3142488 RepID=UPI00319A3A01